VTPRSVTWKEIEDIFHCLAVIFRDEGRTALPPFDSEPSSAIDEDCDTWCRQLPAVLGDAPLPPQHIRSWMLVRAIAVASLAKALAAKGNESPGPLTAQLIEQLLIHEWHGALREKWGMLADYQKWFSC